MRHSFTFALLSLVAVTFAAPLDNFDSFCPAGFHATTSNGCSGDCDNNSGMISTFKLADGADCLDFDHSPGVCLGGTCGLVRQTPGGAPTCLFGGGSIDGCTMTCLNANNSPRYTSFPDRTACYDNQGQSGHCLGAICDTAF